MGEKRPRSKSKHKNVQIWKKYKLDGNKIVLEGKFCPRCGPAIFLAQHKDRISCGKCGYAEIKKSIKQ